MPQAAERLRVALLVEEEGRKHRNNHSFYHVRLHPVHVDQCERVKNIFWDTLALTEGEFHACCLADLVIECQGNSDTRDGVYAWEYFYRPGFVDSKRAARMHKVLSHIDRTMERLRREWGGPSTFGQFCLRVAKAIGATEFLFGNETGPLNERIFVHKELTNGPSNIDTMIATWQEEVKQEWNPLRVANT